MTNLEALKAVVQVENIPGNSFTKALIDAGIDGTATYTSSNATSINAVALEVLKGLLISSISEGGYSISFDRAAIEKKIAVLDGSGVRGVERLNI